MSAFTATDRAAPDPRPDDRQVLTGWLDWQRATVRVKCTGLTDADAHRVLLTTSPAMTIAGVVAHLTRVERGWLVRSFLGDPTADEEGPDWGEIGDPLPALLDAYDRQCERSRQITEAHDLDAVERFAPPGAELVSLRWILGHLIEETARHLGHLDILRELTDGARGY